MIDRLTLRCDFADLDSFDLRLLPIPQEGSIDAQGRLSMRRHPWERIPSHFEPVAFKVYDMTTAKEPRAFIEIKASPAKVMQGHNVWGSDDLAECALALINAVAMNYPEVVELLDQGTWQVREADVTFFSRAESELHALQFIQAMGNVSKGHTRARSGYASTAYFGGKTSRIKKLKLYLKKPEVEQWIKKTLREADGEERTAVFDDRLLAYLDGMIRWEVTLKARWFERRGLSVNLFELRKKWDSVKFWKEGTKDLREALEGQEMKLNDDEQIEKTLRTRFAATTRSGKPTYTKATNCFRTYRLIKELGYSEAQRITTKATFYNHVAMLGQIGISLAALQNIEHGATVIPMVRYLDVAFEAQRPTWANLAA